MENIQIDAVCAAKSLDENWYRAKIVEILPEDCKVQYIDYGNSEIVSKTYIKKLDPQFYPFYEQAVVCGLGLASLEDVVLDELKNHVVNQELGVTLTLDDIGWISEITVDGKNINQTLIKMKLSESIIMEEKESKPECAAKPENKSISALVSHIDSPGQFWLQLMSEMEKLDELGSKIQAEIPNLVDLTNCDIGKTCIAKYSADEQYYRAIILDSDSDIITVRFTDYGNTDVLDNAPGNLKCLPEDLAVVKPYVIKSSVNAFPASMGEWTEAATSLFTQLIGDKEKPIEATTILVDSTTYVDIHVNGINVTEKLVEAGYAVLNEKQNDGKLLTCFTSHINSPSEFWVHLESSVGDLELVSEQLAGAENFDPITEIEEEVICAAKFPDDDNWYRAKIIIHGSDGTEVLFMDYGNASLTDELRNLPEKLKNMPALSRKCALQKPANIKSWSKAAELKFSELAAEGATVFHISFVATGDISIVELYLDNKSITEQLIPLCDTGSGIIEEEPVEKNKILPTVHITCSNGPKDFWIQYSSYADQLNTVMNALMAAEDFDALDDKMLGCLCVSLFSDDNMWYRSSIISVDADEIEVIHIDYGLKAKTNNLKRIPEELINIPPLAKNCLLGKSDKFNQNQCKIFAEITSKQSQIFYVEILDSSEEPETVNLFTKQNDDFVNILTILEDKKNNDLVSDVSVSPIANSEEKTLDEQNDVLKYSVDFKVEFNPVEPEVTNSELILDSSDDTIDVQIDNEPLNDAEDKQSNDIMKNDNDSNLVVDSEKIQFEETTIDSKEHKAENVEIKTENTLEESKISDTNSDSQLKLSNDVVEPTDVPENDIAEKVLNVTDSSVSESICNLSIENQTLEMEDSKDSSDSSSSTITEKDSVTENLELVDSVKKDPKDITPNNDNDTILTKPKIVVDASNNAVDDNPEFKKKEKVVVEDLD